MARALSERRIPLLVGGSLDTKTNPKLVAPPALLELENMFQLRTGEMRPRYGCALLSATQVLGTGTNLFVSQRGGVASIARNWRSLTSQPAAVRYGTTNPTGWESDQFTGGVTVHPYPVYTALISGIEQTFSDGSTVTQSIDPDMMEQINYRIAAWTNGTGLRFAEARETSTGRKGSIAAWGFSAMTMQSAAAVKVCATGGNQSAIFWADAGTTLNAHRYNNGASNGITAITAGLAASPFFDVKAIPGTNNIAVAFKAAAGGVTCCIFNPSTGAITSTVNTAAADASFALAWMDDSFATGNMYLVTAGSTSGVVVRTMSATTMVVSATNVIDATATANIRNVTGHLRVSATDYLVFWDVTAANPVDDIVKQGIWTGAASVVSFANGQSLYSRSAKFLDGNYHILLTMASAVQPGYQLAACDRPGLFGPTSTVGPVCVALAGEGGGRRQASSLASPIISGSAVVIPVARNRKVSTPTGDTSTGFKVISYLSFTAQAQFKARELGGTVFIPGGVMHIDDGFAIQPATFPFYPEVPTTITPSAAGGSMTASGTYSYRVVAKGIDASGRYIRSAASVPASVTLGAGDNRVTLAYNTPALMRGAAHFTVGTGFGVIFYEYYRRGPAATGATLYNKVGESIGGPSSVVTFIDTMSDANAAAGEAAYFNGNVLENFNPPSHSLLEVNGNRVGIVSAEDPTEFWFSKEYKAGAGIGFNPLLKVTITGDGAGGVTALAAMDGNWILFKKTAIYVLSGDGPNDLGQGSFNQPRAVSRTIGTVNPSSVIETPDGIMFQSTMGNMWLLDRGLQLSEVGGPIQAFTSLNTYITGAALSPNGPLVKFATISHDPTSQVLVWDYYHKRWYADYYVTGDKKIVSCANSPIHGFCMLLEDGTLIQESISLARDTFNGTATIIPRISFPHIQLAGLAGYQRLWSIDFTLEALASCTLSVDAEYDFSGNVTGTPKTIAVVTGTAQVQYTPPDGKAKSTSVRPVLTITGSPTDTFKLTGATMTIGSKRGSTVTSSGRMT